MNLLTIQKKYPTQAKCLKTLEKLRWGKVVKCPYCGSTHTRLNKNEQGRHACNNCKRSFTVLVDTIFEHSALPLPTWFFIAAQMLNTKMGLSAKDIEANTGVTYKTAYYTAMRIRIGMLMPETKLTGIIEADDGYFGSKYRATHKHISDRKPSLSTVALKRGRGTNKVSVVAMAERKGNIKTKVIEKLTKRNLAVMLKTYADRENSILVTDGFRSYKALEQYIERLQVTHKKSYGSGMVHINTVESFWSYVKAGIAGNYRSVSKKYLPFYLLEYEFRWNNRNFKGNLFEKWLKNALLHEKELEYWKAQSTNHVKQIAYETK